MELLNMIADYEAESTILREPSKKVTGKILRQAYFKIKLGRHRFWKRMIPEARTLKKNVDKLANQLIELSLTVKKQTD